MCDLDILKALIMPCALVAIEDGSYGKPEVKLTESKSQNQSGYTVNINNIPESSIVIKADTFPPLNRIFNGSKGECKRADFMIITNTPTKKLIIFIEMKKGKGNNREIIQQLKGAQCMVDYFRAIVDVFWGQVNFLDANRYEYRFISIRQIGVDKKPSRQSNRNRTHDQAERMLKIIAPHNLQFKQLI